MFNKKILLTQSDEITKKVEILMNLKRRVYIIKTINKSTTTSVCANIWIMLKLKNLLT